MKSEKKTLQLEGQPESLHHFLECYENERMIAIISGPASPNEMVESLLTRYEEEKKMVKFTLQSGPCTCFQEDMEVDAYINSMEAGWDGYHRVWLITFSIDAYFVNYDHETCPVYSRLLLKAYYDFKNTVYPGVIVAHITDERILEQKEKADLRTVKNELEKTLKLLKDVR